MAADALKPDALGDLDIVVYMYDVCPFCNKVKVFLDYQGIPYRAIEVNPVMRGELKPLSKDYRKVPIAFIQGVQVNDSTAIISELTKLLKERGCYKDMSVSGDDVVAAREEEAAWRGWVDDKLVHTLPPNIYRTTREALQAFNYITEKGNFSAWEASFAKWSGAGAMYLVSKRLKKRHNITDERQALYDCMRDFVTAKGEREFMGGAAPNLADLATFGVLRSIEGLDAFHDLMAVDPDTRAWYDGMTRIVGDSHRTFVLPADVAYLHEKAPAASQSQA
jgi:microsomal prostaglandin-E synthase 2